MANEPLTGSTKERKSHIIDKQTYSIKTARTFHSFMLSQKDGLRELAKGEPL
ncbi:MAG: hypothetical protein ACR2G5_16900 [Pyrinomonadaceae bacterium]